MDGADKKGWSAGLGFVLLAYAASRLFYLLAGALLARVVPVSAFYRITSDAPFGTMNLWSHWDGEHYVALAAGGYLHPPENVSPAFFPLYPLLARSFAEMFGGPASLGALGVWGVLVSLLALPFALYFVYKIAEHARDAATARRTVLVLAFFPTSFFFNAVYTESLFLALSAGSLWAVRVRKDLLLACLLAGLATATRNVGLFLLVPLALEWFGDRHAYRWRGAYLALAPGGLIAYGAYLWLQFGNPWLFYTDQAKWGREATGPLAVVGDALPSALKGAGRILDPGLRADPTLGNLANHLAGANNATNLLFLLFALALLVAGWRWMPPSLTAYALLLVAAPALFGTPQSPLMGMPRYVLVAFPVFIILGSLLGDRRILGGWLALSAAYSLVLCALFVTWRFVA